MLKQVKATPIHLIPSMARAERRYRISAAETGLVGVGGGGGGTEGPNALPDLSVSVSYLHVGVPRPHTGTMS